MIEYDEALTILGDALEPLPDEVVPLAEAAGRVLRERATADRDFPPTDRSAMDGYAVRAADLSDGAADLRLLGEIRAGQPVAGVHVDEGTAVRIMTGAVVPPGADAVVMVERSSESPDGTRVTLRDTPRPGTNVRHRGEDLAAGTAVLEPGRRIGPAEVAALASVGADPVRVTRCAVADVISTGDEVIEPADTPLPHQVRNSNAPMLAAWLRRCGATVRDTTRAADTPDALDAALELALPSDLVLLSGGVSVGRYDLVAAALERAGVRTLFHGVAIKPGKPVLAGIAPSGGLVLGLPGNPVSAFAGFVLFAAAALRRLEGRADWRPRLESAVLGSPLEGRAGRRTFHLATLRTRDDERLRAEPIASRGSGDVLALARADGFVVTPSTGGRFQAGERLPSLRWDD